MLVLEGNEEIEECLQSEYYALSASLNQMVTLIIASSAPAVN